MKILGNAPDPFASHASALRQVRPRSLAQSVAVQIREAIVSGQLKPGTRLVEQKIARTFAIGQPTVREALRELEYDGFIRKFQNRGSYVTELTPEDCSKMFEVRMALESLAIEKAAENISDSA